LTGGGDQSDLRDVCENQKENITKPTATKRNIYVLIYVNGLYTFINYTILGLLPVAMKQGTQEFARQKKPSTKATSSGYMSDGMTLINYNITILEGPPQLNCNILLQDESLESRTSAANTMSQKRMLIDTLSQGEDFSSVSN
jgi:hypothetical protein